MHVVQEGERQARRHDQTCLNWFSGLAGCGTVHWRQTLPSILWKYCHSSGSPIALNRAAPLALLKEAHPNCTQNHAAKRRGGTTF